MEAQNFIHSRKSSENSFYWDAQVSRKQKILQNCPRSVMTHKVNESVQQFQLFSINSAHNLNV